MKEHQTVKKLIVNELLFKILLPFVGLMIIITLYPKSDKGSFIYYLAMACGITVLLGVYLFIKGVIVILLNKKKQT